MRGPYKATKDVTWSRPVAPSRPSSPLPDFEPHLRACFWFRYCGDGVLVVTPSRLHAIDAQLRQHHDGITRRRGRAPLDSTGAPAAWDSETGVWVGVAKKTKPDGVPKPRGRAPLGAEWNYETGEWEGGAKTSAKKKK